MRGQPGEPHESADEKNGIIALPPVKKDPREERPQNRSEGPGKGRSSEDGPAGSQAEQLRHKGGEQDLEAAVCQPEEVGVRT